MIIGGVDQSRLLAYGVELWTRLKSERIAKERIWQEIELAVINKFGKTWESLADYKSKRYLPLPHLALESVSSKYAQGVMPFEDFFDAYGRTPDDEARSKLVVALLKWQHRKRNRRHQIAQIIKNACLYGFSPYKVDWHVEQVAVPDEAAYAQHQAMWAQAASMGQPMAPMIETPQKMVMAYDGPDLQLGNVYDFVIDRWSNNTTYAARCIRFHRTKAYLQAVSEPDESGYALYENVDQLQDMNPENEMSDSLQRQVDTQDNFYNRPTSSVELLECWGDFEIEDNKGIKQLYKNHVLVIGNQQQVLRFEPNPYQHGRPAWQVYTLSQLGSDPYGRGIIEPVLGLADAINVRFNQTIDANTLITNPAFTAVEDGVLDADQLEITPGAVYPMRAQGNLQPLNVIDKSATAFNELGFLMAQLNQSTGAQNSFSTEAYQKSATEVSAEAQASSAKDKETMIHIEQTLIIPIIEMEVQLNQQLMDRPTWIRVTQDQQQPQQPIMTPQGPMMPPPQVADIQGMPIPLGPQTLQVTPEDIQGEFDIVPVGASSMFTAQQELNSITQLISTFGQTPAAMAIKWPDLVQAMFEKARIRDAWKFVKSQQEIQLEQQQQQLAQLAQANASQAPQPAGPGGPGAPGPQPGPGGVPSLAGVGEGKGPLPGGAHHEQLAARRMG